MWFYTSSSVQLVRRPLWYNSLDLIWSCFDDNVVAGGAAQAHIHGDKAHSSLQWLIAVHVTPSEASLSCIRPQPIYILLCLSVLSPSMWNKEKITLISGGKQCLVPDNPNIELLCHCGGGACGDIV